MKLEKAIEYLKDLELTLASTRVMDGTDALELGIEALKRLKEVRQSGLPYLRLPLPGETEE